MTAFLNLYRSNLYSVYNQIATGILGPLGCLPPRPLSNFTYSPSAPCVGRAIQFNSIPPPVNTAVTYLWSFPGANIISSTSVANPSATYNFAGTYFVTLTVTDGSGVQSTTSLVVAIGNCNFDPDYIHNAQWFFGQYANIDFRSGSPVATNVARAHVPPTVFTPEGAYSYCDNSGSLVFYTDGINIWNASHMQVNSTAVFPTLAKFSNSTNGGINQQANGSYGIIGAPAPGQPNVFYLFLAPAFEDLTTNGGTHNKVRYAILNLNSNTVTPAIDLVSADAMCEGLTIAPHCNGTDFWLIAHSGSIPNRDYFYVYLLSKLGLSSSPVMSGSFTYHANEGASIKVSPDNQKIAVAGGATTSTGLGVYSFDNSTGIVSNERNFLYAGYAFSGCSFSSLSSQLYGASYIPQAIIQFNVSSGSPSVTAAMTGNCGFLQLGPDHNIYGAYNSNQTLQIANPDNTGVAILNAVNYSSLTPAGIEDISTSIPNLMDGIQPAPVAPSFTVAYSSCLSVTCAISQCWQGYSYSWDFGDGTNGVGSPINHTYSAQGLYTVLCTLTIPGGTGSIAFSQTVNVINSTVSISAAPGPICLNNSLPLVYSVPTVSGAIYSWSISSNGTLLGANIGSQIEVQWNSGATGTVGVTITDGSCVSTGSLNVTLLTPPNVTVSAIPTVICSSGGPVTLTANGAITYSWTFNSNTASSNPITDIPASTTTYSVTGTGANGCASLAVVTVVTSSPPTVTANTVSPKICFGGSSSLIASGGNTYSWSSSAGLNPTNVANPIATPVSTTTYTVTGSNSSGCQSTATVTITVDPLLIATSPNQQILCLGGSVTLGGSPTAIGGTTPYTYSWSPGNFSSANPVVIPSGTITYTLFLRDMFGCLTSVTTTVYEPNTNKCCGSPFITICGSVNSSSINILANKIVDVCPNAIFTINNSAAYSGCTFRMGANAKIIVSSGSTLTLSGCHFFACSDMWDGIFIEPSGNLSSTNDIYNDAYHAIASVLGGTYTVSGSTFDNNYIGIVDSTYATGPHTGKVISSTFKCSGTLRAPYAAKRGFAGISVLGVRSGITIGEAIGTSQNIFNGLGTYGLQYGIVNDQSTYMTVYNCHFSNFFNDVVCSPSGPRPVACVNNGVCIWAKNHGTIVVGGTSPSQANSFGTSSFGIIAENSMNLDIRSNAFTNFPPPNPNTNIHSGVCILVQNSTSILKGTASINISDNNTFKNFWTGVSVFNYSTAPISIRNNTFNNFSSFGITLRQVINSPIGIQTNVFDATAPNLGTSTAIDIGNPVISSVSSTSISANDINSCKNGIVLTNFQGAHIINNDAVENPVIVSSTSGKVVEIYSGAK
jgi:PKD repeat protein